MPIISNLTGCIGASHRRCPRLWCLYFALSGFVWVIPCVAWSASTDLEELWLSVQINQQQQTDTLLFLRQKNGKLWIASKDWQQWRLRLPSTLPVKHEDEDYYAIDEIKGVSYRINDAALSMALTVDVALFESTQLNGLEPIQSVVVATPLGALLNYDVASSYTDGQIKSNAFIEAVVFNQWGVLENQLLLRDLEEKNRRLTRLDTTFTRDNLPELSTLKLGDAVTTNMGLGGSVRFAGLQWARNFALQPSRITFPLPSMSGEAVLPSNVDIFINNAKSLSREVPIGAFTIQDIPVVSGQGEARMVIKDVLGREQVVILPYYVSPNLLQMGLQEYSYELGFVRENYGVDNQNYGHLLAVVSHRVGISDDVTAEFEGQFLQTQQLLSYGSVFLWPKLGVLHGVVAASWHQQQGTGQALSVAIEHQAPQFSWGANIQSQSRDFVNVASQTEMLPVKQQGQLFASMSVARYGSLSSSYTFQKTYDQQTVDFLQGTYSVSFGQWGALTASVTRSLSPNRQTTSQISLSVPLDFSTSSNFSIQPSSQQQRLSIQRSVPTGSGFGYSFATEQGRIQRDEAALALQNNIAKYKIRATQQNDNIGGEASMTGAVTWLDGEAIFSRRINNSFAVVKVPNYSQVRVYSDNQLIGKTNRRGSVLVPRLRPYQKNRLRIDAADLPFDTQIDAAQVDVYPSFRSGIVVPFPVKRSDGATLTLLLDNGEPVPAGAVVTKQGSVEEFPVGFRGELYLTGLNAQNTIRVEWKNQSCALQVAFVQAGESLPDLGSYVCKGVKP